jgi:hypothetical protein
MNYGVPDKTYHKCHNSPPDPNHRERVDSLTLVERTAVLEQLDRIQAGGGSVTMSWTMLLLLLILVVVLV